MLEKASTEGLLRGCHPSSECCINVYVCALPRYFSVRFTHGRLSIYEALMHMLVLKPPFICKVL